MIIGIAIAVVLATAGLSASRDWQVWAVLVLVTINSWRGGLL
jgi:hypothetical protein